MTAYRSLVCIWGCLLGGIESFGQHYSHTAAWFRLAPSVEIDKRWTLTGDVWYRRQSDLHLNILNPFAAPLLNVSGRVGISHRIKHWSITLYPMAVYRSFPALGKEADYSRPQVSELRPHLLVEWDQALRAKLSIRVRGGYEYRHFLSNPITTAGRGRLRVMLRHDFAKFYVSLWNEILVPLWPHNTVRQWCEINRTSLAAGYNLSKHLVLEAGYQFSYRQRRSLTEFDEEHALTATAYCRF